MSVVPDRSSWSRLFRRRDRAEPARSLPARYGPALIACSLFIAANLLLTGLWRFPLFLPGAAVFVSACLGGLGPGLLAVALSAGTLAYFPLSTGGYEDLVLLGLFIVVGTGLSILVASRRRALGEAERLGVLSRQQVGQLKTLFEIAPVGIAVAHDPDCRTITTNPAAASILGVPVEANVSLSGPGAAKLPYRMLKDGRELAPRDLPLQRAAAERASVRAEELNLVLADGRCLTVYASAAPVVAGDGRVTGAVGAFLDVSGQRQAEEALRASEERLRLATEAARLVPWDWDLGTGRVEWSAARGESLGAELDLEGPHEAFRRLVHPDDLSRVECEVRRAIEHRDHFETQFRLLLPSGRLRWGEVKGKVLSDGDGVAARVIGVASDITENKRREEEREAILAREGAARAEADRAQRRLRRLAESRIIGVVFGESGIFTEANDAFLDMVGYSHEDLRAGRLRWREMTPPEYREADERGLEELRTRGELTPYAKEYWRKDGSRVPVLVGGAVLEESASSMAGVAFVLDLTERRRVEQERDRLLEREKMARVHAEAANRAKDEFLALLSHELRSPLSAIQLWTANLRSGALDGARTADALAAIERSVITQTRLIEDLLDVSRIVAGKLRIELRHVDLAGTVTAAIDAVSDAAAVKTIRFDTALERGLGVRGDPARLQQVVWNLLSNAVKFSPPDCVVSVRLARAGLQAVLTVRDEGEGIPPAFLPHVFERFRQADSSRTRAHCGLGLGLAIAHHVVETHGGTIVAASPGAGRGATFTVCLPLLEEGADRPPALRPSGSPRGAANGTLAGVRVLVVDDDPEARQSIARFLERYGATATAVHSVSEAVDRLRRERPHVLLSDIGMPGEDGYALMRWLHAHEAENGGGIPAAALTAYAGREERELVLSQGFQAHLAKPVPPDELLAVVSRLARAGRASRTGT